MRRRLSTGALVAIGVLTLVLLIGVVTFIALNVISDTVLDQFEAAELQLVTSLSQQAQATLFRLESEVFSLAVREEIRATSATRQEQAIDLLRIQAANYPNQVISITRFDFRGNPYYAWPADLNSRIPDLQDPATYRYQVPPELLALTERGQRVSSEIDIQIYRQIRADGQGERTLLIAPVDSVNLRTEFIIVELDLGALFADQFGFVELGTSGQVWVFDGRGQPIYSARLQPNAQDLLNAFSLDDFFASSSARLDSYPHSNGTRQIAVARAQALSENFLVFLSRDQSEAQQAVTENVLYIFIFSVVAMLGTVGLGSVVARQINRANAAQRDESQRRETARILLDISRALNSSLDLTTVLRQILNELQRLVPHDSASVLLLEDAELRVAANRGMTNEAIGQTLRLEEARAAHEVIFSGQPLVINDTRQDKRWTEVEGAAIISWMGLPLRVRDQLVGVLNVNSHHVGRFNPQDIELAEAFADQASVALQNARLHEIEVKQIEQELEIARGIQASLLPDTPPPIPQLEVLTQSLPASQVSGDYYQYLPMPNGRLGLAIGDVQGKGIPAALLMAVISTALRDEAVRHQDPAALLQALNTRLIDRMQRNHMNSALLVAAYDASNRQLEIANGGMVQPYIRNPNESTFDFVPVGGYPLGVSGSMKYSAKTLDFGVGSMMVIFSDGVLEAQNEAGEFLGFERVESLLNEIPADADAELVMGRILAAVRDHLGELAPQDDTTIMVIRALDVPVAETFQPETMPSVDTAAQAAAVVEALHPIAEQSADNGHTETPLAETEAMSASSPTTNNGGTEESILAHIEGSKGRKNIELFLPSQLGFERVARSAVETLAEEMGLPADKIEDLKTAISEACMNAIEHGNAEDKAQSVSIFMSATERSMEIRVTDRGKKRLPKELPPPGEGDMRGWGLFFIQNLMDIFSIEHLPDGGNQVLMVTYVKDDAQALDSDAQIGHNEV